MKKFKIKIPNDLLCALYEELCTVLNDKWDDDDDRLLMAVMAEVKSKLYAKIDYYKPQHSVSFTPAQALAIRNYYLSFHPNDVSSYIGNGLHRISCMTDQFFAK